MRSGAQEGIRMSIKVYLKPSSTVVYEHDVKIMDGVAEIWSESLSTKELAVIWVDFENIAKTMEKYLKGKC